MCKYSDCLGSLSLPNSVTAACSTFQKWCKKHVPFNQSGGVIARSWSYFFHSPNSIRCWNESAFYITEWKSDHHSSWAWWCSMTAFPGNVQLWDTSLLKFILPSLSLHPSIYDLDLHWYAINNKYFVYKTYSWEKSSDFFVHCSRRIRSLQLEFKFAICLHTAVS